jgi:hypothetical protein
MPTVIRLGNAKIAIYASDHNPPHFHLLSAEHAAVVSLKTLEIVSGSVPRQVYEVARACAADHMDLLEKIRAQLND